MITQIRCLAGLFWRVRFGQPNWWLLLFVSIVFTVGSLMSCQIGRGDGGISLSFLGAAVDIGEYVRIFSEHHGLIGLLSDSDDKILRFIAAAVVFPGLFAWWLLIIVLLISCSRSLSAVDRSAAFPVVVGAGYARRSVLLAALVDCVLSLSLIAFTISLVPVAWTLFHRGQLSTPSSLGLVFVGIALHCSLGGAWAVAFASSGRWWFGAIGTALLAFMSTTVINGQSSAVLLLADTPAVLRYSFLGLRWLWPPFLEIQQWSLANFVNHDGTGFPWSFPVSLAFAIVIGFRNTRSFKNNEGSNV